MTYSYEIFIIKEDGSKYSGAEGTFTTGSLPLGLTRASFTVTQGSPTFPLALKDHVDQAFRGYVILDNEANVAWYLETPELSPSAIRQTPDNTFVYVASHFGLREVTPLGETVAELVEDCPNTTTPILGRIHHEVILDLEGNILYLSTETHDVFFGDILRPQASDSIGIWDRQNSTDLNILFDVFDHISPHEDRTSSSDNPNAVFFWHGCPEVEGLEDWTHANSLDVGLNGNILLSMRHVNQIISIAPDFQSVEWRLGGENSDFSFPNPIDRFYHQHTVSELPNGNILLFDNGNDRPEEEGGGYSRALELQLDFEEMTATRVWEFRHPDNLFALCCSSAFRLENGNTVIVFGSDFGADLQNPKPLDERVFTLVEVDQKGDIVWEVGIKFAEPDVISIQYRVYPIFSINGEIELEREN